jgi:ribosomal protein S12 methylthiotransferase
VNLVAQDLAHYGRDRRDGSSLPDLLSALVRETSIPWFRNMYLYSAGITPKLLDVIAAEPRIMRYLDMPMQHASDRMLTAMRRPERKRTIREKVARFREVVPELAIRTTVIVGFPGETDDDVDQLCDFLEELRLERVGVFSYSPQEGTHAATLTDDVADSLKRERHERVSELQRAITADRYEERVGSVATALVDYAATSEDPALARLPWQADDIDGLTRLDVDATPGSMVEVGITGVVDDYDFTARVIRTSSLPAKPAAARRPLAVLSGASSMGSFGR